MKQRFIIIYLPILTVEKLVREKFVWISKSPTDWVAMSHQWAAASQFGEH